MLRTNTIQLKYDELLESALVKIGDLLRDNYDVSKRTIGLLLLQGVHQIERQVGEQDGAGYTAMKDIVAKTRASYSQHVSYIINLRHQQTIRRILAT